MSEPTYPQGATVKFKGGLGRGNDADVDVIYAGIVNGPTYFEGDGAYVPIHLPQFNHNLVVVSTNIVEIVR